MSPSLVDVDRAEKKYVIGDQEFCALKSVSFSVKTGDFLALVGSSGSGKTTMLNLIGGLDLPTAGQVRVNDKNLTDFTSDELSVFRRETLGFIFQTFNLIPVLTARENVEYPLLKRKDIGSEERNKRSQVALESVGLGHLADRFPNQLSGGQRQRVAIARALVHSPLLIIADEPTANLDRSTAREVLQIMKKLNSEKGITFIFSTHDPEIMGMAQRVIFLADGQIEKEVRQNLT